ncbi:uncharacterized protein AMSG_06729 [Thecamonas trahens ATCC 50062]|uniref:Uncharacterized protein n=1 Tax=Thecamonas trahens ATCC 50062 TaxID=461836 RepID=A0A0L0DFA6_THETB|nr:hypothetical protein AMSG_06729 [Thecamonas trahens ATCC 50062]KNC50826.1 hypothetical protein AMSG_06729 [Thecamonas trahens ATCC 50062]|eukprot:XP_013756781.1 hypothetical protein AMSG_06729 [Thecamonas trahens ATCC 50062]
MSSMVSLVRKALRRPPSPPPSSPVAGYSPSKRFGDNGPASASSAHAAPNSSPHHHPPHHHALKPRALATKLAACMVVPDADDCALGQADMDGLAAAAAGEDADLYPPRHMRALSDDDDGDDDDGLLIGHAQFGAFQDSDEDVDDDDEWVLVEFDDLNSLLITDALAAGAAADTAAAEDADAGLAGLASMDVAGGMAHVPGLPTALSRRKRRRDALELASQAPGVFPAFSMLPKIDDDFVGDVDADYHTIPFRSHPTGRTGSSFSSLPEMGSSRGLVRPRKRRKSLQD